MWFLKDNWAPMLTVIAVVGTFTAIEYLPQFQKPTEIEVKRATEIEVKRVQDAETPQDERIANLIKEIQDLTILFDEQIDEIGTQLMYAEERIDIIQAEQRKLRQAVNRNVKSGLDSLLLLGGPKRIVVVEPVTQEPMSTVRQFEESISN